MVIAAIIIGMLLLVVLVFVLQWIISSAIDQSDLARDVAELKELLKKSELNKH
ncbi:hypothetical protein [Paenibacillus nanensis]|uniref:hypothetical protein n=1 Tax=Paenibacillus nanensis TaxID=393251 RepID=UPI0013C2A0FA|nr:hypothetical protein [Paenibacillus nanensis]